MIRPVITGQRTRLTGNVYSKALADRLLALSNQLSMLSLPLCIKTNYFSQNKFYYRISVLEQPVQMHFQTILIVGILFHKLVFTVKTSCTPLRVPLVMFLYAIPQTEETIIMHIPALFCTILTAYFTSLMHSENFKNAFFGFQHHLS